MPERVIDRRAGCAPVTVAADAVVAVPGVPTTLALSVYVVPATVAGGLAGVVLAGAVVVPGPEDGVVLAGMFGSVERQAIAALRQQIAIMVRVCMVFLRETALF